MIHMMTRGGLGNQMFQYALALQIQKINKDKTIWIDGELHPLSIDKRKQSLYHFALTPETKICSRLNAFCLIGCFVLKLLMTAGMKSVIDLIRYRRLRDRNLMERLINKGLYYTDDPYSMPAVKAVLGTKHIYAYAQSPDVLGGIETELQAAFTVVTRPSEQNQRVLDEINSCNAVCLHIRRGDYSLYPQYQVCDEAYFTKAVKQACEMLHNPVFYVFSNKQEDIEWIKENYHFDANIRYVELENPDYEELRLMQSCRHFIISNSTFSWWAAVLSSKAGDDKKVWAPKCWFNGNNVKMTLDTWTLL